MNGIEGRPKPLTRRAPLAEAVPGRSSPRVGTVSADTAAKVEPLTDRSRDALCRADELARSGQPDAAFAVLAAAVDEQDHPHLWRRLVAVRHEAHLSRPPSSPVPFEPPRAAPLAHPGDLPELDVDDLDLDSLRAGLAHHGCVLVRGLLREDVAARLRAGIDRALEAFDEADRTGADFADHGWYSQFTPTGDGYRVGGRRKWVRASGALWTADSPRMFRSLLAVVEETGVLDLVTSYLGERPALSANKCTLRRVPLSTSTGWHQDGAFLGEGVRSLNLWLALGSCGSDAPGLDLVPRRIDRVVPSGTEGATFDWSVAPDVVAHEAGEAGVIRPEFRPGDALIFDHLFLHSTAVEEEMTNERHAMETWFFAPSAYPDGQIPIAL